MNANFDQKTWNYIARKTKKHPMFESAVFCDSSGSQYYITQTRKRYFYFLWLVPWASLLIYFALTKNLYIAGNIILLLIGLLILYACFRTAMCVDKVHWNPLSGSISIKYGNIFISRNLTLHKSNIIVQYYYCDEENAKACENLKKQYVLSIKKKDGDETEIKIALASTETEIKPILRSLEIFLGTTISDSTLEEIHFPEFEELTTSKSLLDEGIGSLLNAKLISSTRDLMRFRYSRLKQMIISLIILIVTVGFCSLILNFINLTYQVKIFLALCILPFVYLSFQQMIYFFKNPEVIADRREKILYINSPAIIKREGVANKNRFSFDTIAAFQLCGKNPDPEKDDYAEFNVILRKPPGKRLNIASNTRESVLRPQAGKFAEFVGKPLIDHSQS